jgi:hypothetical protein
MLLDRLPHSSFVLDADSRIRAWGWDRQLLILQKGQMLFHPPACLVKAILDGMADSGESLQLGRVKPKEDGIIRRFDDERVLEIDHVTPPDTCSQLLLGWREWSRLCAWFSLIGSLCHLPTRVTPPPVSHSEALGDSFLGVPRFNGNGTVE